MPDGQWRYHNLKGTTAERYAGVRVAAVVFGDEIMRYVPAGENRDRAIAAVEEAVFHADMALGGLLVDTSG